MEDLNKFKVPALKETLAWLWNRDISDKVVTKKLKAELIDSIIIAIEVLLPDMCSICQSEYSVGRLDSPGLRCKSCFQGFHQPCLEELLGGQKCLPKLPGMLYWLCATCSPNYTLMTSSGGTRSAAGRKLLSPVHDLFENPPPSSESGAVAASLPPATIRAGLPYLWPTQTDQGKASSPACNSLLSPPPPPPPPPTVRSGLPFLWAEKVNQSQQQSEIASPSPDCLPYLRGECPHGISGKLNGLCDKKHPKRCI